MSLQIYKDMLVDAWPALAQYAVVTVIIMLLPDKNLPSIILAVLIPAYLKDMYIRKPDQTRWKVLAVDVALWTSGFVLLWRWAGASGFLVLFLCVVALAAFQIYKGWSLFDAYTSSVADWVKGKPFKMDLGGAVSEGSGREQGVSSVTGEQQGEGSGVVEESRRDVDESADRGQALQAVQGDGIQRCSNGLASRQEQALPDVHEGLGSNNEKLKEE